MNELRLAGRIAERKAIRYTPAGLSVVELTLGVEGEVVEAGSVRSLSFEADSIAIGGVATELAALPLGSQLTATGFIAPTRRKARKLVFHITAYTVTAAGSAATDAKLEH